MVDQLAYTRKNIYNDLRFSIIYGHLVCQFDIFVTLFGLEIEAMVCNCNMVLPKKYGLVVASKQLYMNLDGHISKFPQYIVKIR